MAVGAIDNTAGTTSASSVNRFGEMTSEEFVRILITELTSQDPLQPNDSSKILEQLSSLRNIESDMSLQENLNNLVMQNQVAQASALIGKLVQGLDLNNNRTAGLVTSVRVVDGEAYLELDTGKFLPMTRVEIITEDTPEDTSGQTDTETDTGTGA